MDACCQGYGAYAFSFFIPFGFHLDRERLGNAAQEHVEYPHPAKRAWLDIDG